MIFSGTIEAANRQLVRKQDDYEENGLLHCGICRKAKQTVLPINPVIGIYRPTKVRCSCGCDIAAEEQRKLEERKQDTERKRQICFNGSTKRISQTFESADQTLPSMKKAMAFCENFTQQKQRDEGLIFYGNIGTGKSYCAAAIANRLIEKGFSCRMINAATLLSDMQSSQDRSYYISSLLRHRDLLIIDDIGAERDSTFASEIMFSVIDAVYNSRTVLVCTTNLQLEELKNPADIRYQRIYDRIREKCQPILFSGSNQRDTIRREHRDHMAEVFRKQDG